MNKERRLARSRLASAAATAAKHPNDPVAAATVAELRRDYVAVALEEHIRAVVDEAPPLSEVQRARLAGLLLGARRDEAASAA